jgi:hypothetical protein
MDHGRKILSVRDKFNINPNSRRVYIHEKEGIKGRYISFHLFLNSLIILFERF